MIDRNTEAQMTQNPCYAPFVIFLDIDGVFNCQIFYQENYKKVKKRLRKQVKSKEIKRLERYKNQICPDRIKWFSELCKEVKADVVISSTWRIGKSVEELQEIMNYCGGSFRIIGKTENLGYERGIEISKWLKDNVKPETYGCNYYDFHRYAIIDDDSDMLLNQRFNFFQTDNYSGLTPNTCYKIKRFFSGRTFGSPNGE